MTSNLDSLTVFEIDRVSGTFAVALPPGWARMHRQAEVALSASEEFGCAAEILGDAQDHLLGFPWLDNVDEILLGSDTGRLPVQLGERGWNDVEQGWWASVIPFGDSVFLAEADFDELLDNVRDPQRLARPRDGVVTVDGVPVRWNAVPRSVYDDAWIRAATQLRNLK
jgi:hypothetical protein